MKHVEGLSFMVDVELMKNDTSSMRNIFRKFNSWNYGSNDLLKDIREQVDKSSLGRYLCKKVVGLDGVEFVGEFVVICQGTEKIIEIAIESILAIDEKIISIKEDMYFQFREQIEEAMFDFIREYPFVSKF